MKNRLIVPSNELYKYLVCHDAGLVQCGLPVEQQHVSVLEVPVYDLHPAQDGCAVGLGGEESVGYGLPLHRVVWRQLHTTPIFHLHKRGPADLFKI